MIDNHLLSGLPHQAVSSSRTGLRLFSLDPLCPEETLPGREAVGPVVKSKNLSTRFGWVLITPVPVHGDLSVSLNLSVPQFPSLQNGHKNSAFRTGTQQMANPCELPSL